MELAFGRVCTAETPIVGSKSLTEANSLPRWAVTESDPPLNRSTQTASSPTRVSHVVVAIGVIGKDCAGEHRSVGSVRDRQKLESHVVRFNSTLAEVPDGVVFQDWVTLHRRKGKGVSPYY